MSCTHVYQFQGAVHHAGHQLPGSGAHERVYEDKYVCMSCLDIQYISPRVFGNTYSKPLEGTLPK